MEKHEITLALDSERMGALTFYLKKENTTVQRKMDEALQQLYEETVPEPIREFLDAKSAPQRPKRPARPSQPKGEQSKASSAPVGERKEGGENKNKEET